MGSYTAIICFFCVGAAAQLAIGGGKPVVGRSHPSRMFKVLRQTKEPCFAERVHRIVTRGSR